ncbi:BrnA antitoxin family protein [Limnohabitans sp. T6-5]|uniref:BrnA antitoxin family protein n=1 Tax=Limnohabitans sp. T6-5 TaxID=1100724 RepID=UPI003516EB7E
MFVRYSSKVLVHFQSTGDGWQSRMDSVLRQYVASDSRGACAPRPIMRHPTLSATPCAADQSTLSAPAAAAPCNWPALGSLLSP